MGGTMTRVIAGEPDRNKLATTDPLYGFPEGRKERVMIATKEEMDSVRLGPEFRDYCAHILVEYMGCRAYKAPFLLLCAPYKHAHVQCEFEDYVLRMKEFEREKRLQKRAAKRQKEIID